MWSFWLRSDDGVLPDDGDREAKLERLRAWQNDANRSLTDEEIRQKYQLPGAPFVWKRGA